MKTLALRAIALYRRHLSPRKGYACAWRVHTGGASCSAYGYRVIERHGLRLGLVLLKRRLAACSAACRHHPAAGRRLAGPQLGRQAGFCDAPGCDLPSVDLPSCNPAHGGLSCDVIGLLSDCSPYGCHGCGDGWGRKRGRGDPHVGIVPNAPPFEDINPK